MSELLRRYHVISGVFYGIGTPLICAILTYLIGDTCWPQRLGAVYVGAAVFTQGFLAADNNRFSRE